MSFDSIKIVAQIANHLGVHFLLLLEWFGHEEHKDDTNWVKCCSTSM